MAKNEENGLAFFTELQAYIEANGHLPDKHVVENRGLLSKAKYLRKKIKAGTAEDWMGIIRWQDIWTQQEIDDVIASYS